MKTGQFITVEGTDGAGKSTQIAFIKNLLEVRDIPHTITREPGGTDMGEAIRDVLLGRPDLHATPSTQLLLIFAARAQHLEEMIKPSLAQGKWVICDRFTDASYAYQGEAGGLGFDAVSVIEQWVQGDLRPDLTVLLDVPLEVGLSRLKLRGDASDRFEEMDLDRKRRIRDAYLKLAGLYSERIKVVDASQSIARVKHEVERLVSARVDQWLNH